MSYKLCGPYQGDGAGGDGPGWYGNADGVVRCFGTNRNDQPRDCGWGSKWYKSREEAERELNHKQRPDNSKKGGKRKYSRRRRGLKKTKRSRK